ncbi:MAG TPA: HAMP domain-containing sensor histidine kinase [Methyloceanibacter sp.]|nr:HAMP domain-containing sensor histidine kinase [Methyloceanibacter sp.]
MADLGPQRRMNQLEGDREALEHIARALEGRVLAGPGSATPTETAPSLAAPSLSPEGVALLLEGVPAAVGILAKGALVHVNTAFAYAFGYRSPAELLEAGGLEAILGGVPDLMQCENGAARTVPLEALSRSRRRLQVAFALSQLDGEQDVKLLRLIDQTDLDEEAAASPDKPEPTADAQDAPLLNADAAARRLEFLAKVSHEVRTPLNSIIGFTELMLQERFGAIGNARYSGYIEDIHQSGLYALSLLNDLLDISKIEAGKFELNFTAVDVPELVEDCVTSLQPLAKRARIVLRTSFAADLPSVVADPRRLKQILLNLLTNAIKFTKEGGQVIVSVSAVDGELRLRVRDDGVGMTKDEIAFAMQPFNQLDTAPRKQTGTGLGLPVTKALVDANRARLVLASEPGVGTSADVIFPAERLFTGGAT